MAASWRERLTEGETEFCSDGPCSVNLQSIFLLMGGAVFTPCCLTWGQTTVEVMKIMVTSFKSSMHTLLHSVPLTLQQAASDPCLHWRLWTLMGKSGSVSYGVTVLSPGSLCTQSFVCALQESVSPVLCKLWWLCGGLNGDLLQEGLCHTQVCCTQSPCPCGRPLLTCASSGDTQTLKGRSGSVSVGPPGVPRFCLSPLRVSGGYGVSFSMWFCPAYHITRASPLPFNLGYLFLVESSILLLLMVVQQLVVTLEFLQETMSTKQVVSYKIKCIRILTWFWNFTPIYIRETKTCSYKDLYTNVQRSLIPNSSKVNQQLCISG